MPMSKIDAQTLKRRSLLIRFQQSEATTDLTYERQIGAKDLSDSNKTEYNP